MNLQQPQDQIRELLARYIKGECIEEEIALLEEWYRRITTEKSVVPMLSPAEEERLVVELWKAIAEREAQQRGSVDNHTRPERYSRKALRYAALWAGILLLSGGIYLQWSRRSSHKIQQVEPAFIEVATGYEQVRKVLLPDSSVVWLNSATHLYYHPDFTGHREIRLVGEAFFQVAPDGVHPFVVNAGNASTWVLGTAFNVSAYPHAGQLRISLQSGKVGVVYQGKTDKLDKVLQPGELLVFDRESDTGQVMKQSPAEMNVWTGGLLLFYKTPLKEALAQIEARYGVHFVYQHPLKNTKTVTARFENTALDKVLEGLAFGWDLHFTRHGDSLQVRSR